jgi:hypothetical protein
MIQTGAAERGITGKLKQKQGSSCGFLKLKPVNIQAVGSVTATFAKTKSGNTIHSPREIARISPLAGQQQLALRRFARKYWGCFI